MSSRRRILALSVLLTALSAAGPRAAAAASPATAASAVPASPSAMPAEPVAPDSPRAALRAFRHLTRTGDYSGAAAYLDLSKVDQNDGPELARELREVLDRHLTLDPAKIPSDSEVKSPAGVRTDRVLLGSVPGATGEPEPVSLQRNSYRAGSHWLFSADTVAHTQSWYDHLGNLWLSEHMPRSLQGMGPYHVRRWQWLMLLPLLAGGWLLAWGVTRLARVGVRLVLKRDSQRLHAMRGPAALGVAVAIWYAGLPSLGLYDQADAAARRWLSAALLLALFWAVWRGVELWERSVGASQWAKGSPTAHSLLLLGSRLAKFAVAAVAFIVVLAELGYHATTIITGLGIGGIALALAAQKTVENLFGAFSLAIDQPFRVGDSITVDGINGVVETIGLRSTRIRTGDRSIISIPNGKLADMRVETLAHQDRIRFSTVIGIEHSPSERIHRILSGIEALLRKEPLIDQASTFVHLVGLTDSAMNIEVDAQFTTTDGNAFAKAREALLLGLVEVVEQAGSALAHPTRTLQLSAPPARSAEEQGDSRSDTVPESGNRGAARLSKSG